MNDFMNSLPSLGQMVKLIIFLILALIVFGLVSAIVKTVFPIALLAAVIVVAAYFFKKMQANGA